MRPPLKILWLDTETTGVEPGVHAVQQIAGIIDIGGQVVEEFEYFARPYEGQIFTAEALKITGKTVEEVKAYPDPREVHVEIKQKLAKYSNPYTKVIAERFCIGGQNTEFDYGMMQAFFMKAGDKYWYSWCDRRGVDLLAISRIFQIAGKLALENVKLETVAKALGVPLEAHNALNDIRATRACYYKLAEMLATIPLPVRA